MDSTNSNLSLYHLLKETSRSFYLTVRILPRRIRPQIALAYLLARMTDTVADTEIVSPELRLQSLSGLHERILGDRARKLELGEFSRQQGSPGERRLLDQCETLVDLLNTFRARDREHIRRVLEIIISGQALDLKRFALARADAVQSLATLQELDDYTWRVAGCVGEFWTHMCCDHLFRVGDAEKQSLIEKGVRFGKGLQLVNILRDLPRDLRQGRCYLPTQELDKLGLAPSNLTQPERFSRLQPFYHSLLDLTREHLRAGWSYTCALPRGQFRLRLACAWPVLIGVRTISLLRRANILDAEQRVKVSRGEVYRLMLRTTAAAPFPRQWERLFERSEQG